MNETKFEHIPQKVISLNTFLNVEDKVLREESRKTLLGTWQDIVNKRGRIQGIEIVKESKQPEKEAKLSC